MFMMFAGVTALFFLLFTFAFYFFVCYALYRVGQKFRIGSYVEYCIPIYNATLLCDCAGITKWTAAGLILPVFCSGVFNMMRFGIFLGTSGFVLYAVFFACWVYLWGSIAQRLGKNFWLWGIFTFVFGGLPILFLAFDGSMPRR